MGTAEILVIIGAAAIVAGVLIAAAVRKKKGKPSCDCDCCCCSKKCSLYKADKK